MRRGLMMGFGDRFGTMLTIVVAAVHVEGMMKGIQSCC
jgi:hypothetical protein